MKAKRLTALVLTVMMFLCSFDAQAVSGILLPKQITAIETEAFAGVASDVIIVPDSCTTIEPGAFSNCENLRYIRLPADVEIPDDAFTGCPNVVIDQR